MPIPIDTLLGWCNVPDNRKNAVTQDLIHDGLEDLSNYSVEEIKDAIKGYKTQTGAPKFTLSLVATKRLTQLSLWVKDRTRLLHPVEFDDLMDMAQFQLDIYDAELRDKIRTERRKSTESLSTIKISPPLRHVETGTHGQLQ
jgi:hypothetical protein